MTVPMILQPARHGDARGWFSETWNRRRAAEQGIDCDFVQDNHSWSAQAGTIRGLHMQLPPHAQAKLVRCVRGTIWDVAVDVRAASPTYGRWVAAILSAENGCQLFVPVGFAHGFMTLADDAEVAYKASDYYAPASEFGFLWSDPALAIAWPLGDADPVVSEKDAALPVFAGWNSPFAYDGAPLVSLDLNEKTDTP